MSTIPQKFAFFFAPFLFRKQNKLFSLNLFCCLSLRKRKSLFGYYFVKSNFEFFQIIRNRSIWKYTKRVNIFALFYSNKFDKFFPSSSLSLRRKKMCKQKMLQFICEMLSAARTVSIRLVICINMMRFFVVIVATKILSRSCLL